MASATRSSSIGSPTAARLTGSSWAASLTAGKNRFPARFDDTGLRRLPRRSVERPFARCGPPEGHGVLPDDRRFPLQPDGTRLVSQDQLRVLEGSNLKEQRSRPKAQAVVFLSNDELMIHEAGSLKGWDLRTGRETFTFAIPKGMAYDIRSDAELPGSLVLLMDRAMPQVATLWDARTGEQLPRLDDVTSHGKAPYRLGNRRPATGPLLALDVRSRPGEILLYDTTRGSTRGRIPGVMASGGFADSTLSPDGRLLVAYAQRNDGSFPSMLHVWEVETGRQGRHAPGLQGADLEPRRPAPGDDRRGDHRESERRDHDLRSPGEDLGDRLPDPDLSPGPADPGDLDVQRPPATRRGRSALAGRLGPCPGAPRPAQAAGRGRSPRPRRSRDSLRHPVAAAGSRPVRPIDHDPPGRASPPGAAPAQGRPHRRGRLPQ